MSDEGFFRRWARLKSSGGDAAPAPPVPVTQAAAASRTEAEAGPQAPLPTLEDLARLTPDADFSAFVAQGVDKSVRRLALKKLFTDPHFHAIDGLDMYMSDYNKPSPLTPDMLASLRHAPGVLSRLLGDGQDAPDPATQAQEVQQVRQTEGAPGQERTPLSTRQGKA